MDSQALGGVIGETIIRTSVGDSAERNRNNFVLQSSNGFRV